MLKTVNDRTREITSIRNHGDVSGKWLQEPDIEIYPQMRIVGVTRSHKGRYGEAADGGQSIAIDDITTSIFITEEAAPSTSVGVTYIIASAGSGKTTLFGRIAQKALEISLEKEVIRPKMVHYVQLNDIQEQQFIKPSTFLFGDICRNEQDQDRAFRFLVEHQTEVILIFDGFEPSKFLFGGSRKKSAQLPRQSISNFDGLDQAGRYFRKIKEYETASTSTIMYNILARNILRHVKIFVASREYKDSDLPTTIQPKRILTLHGFTAQDSQRLFISLLGESGVKVWKKIETASPRLLQLVSVPAHLILTAILMRSDPNSAPPASLTELHYRILLCLENVQNGHQVLNKIYTAKMMPSSSSAVSLENAKNELFGVTPKLKAMAFRGLSEEKIVFHEIDLMRFNLSAVDVQYLMTESTYYNSYSSRHATNFTFPYVRIQEFLAASFIAEMKLEEFSRFNGKYLHTRRWSGVRTLVSGIVFSGSTKILHAGADL